jgi:DNA (cytosine-5)-methyltransferase 3A
VEKIKILSIFDGISGCRQALKEMDIDCDYYSSEVDKFAIQISQANHPDIKQIGDVKDLDNWNLVLNDLAGITNSKQNQVDLLCGGFPCQPFSIAGNKKGFADERGQLFFEALRILEEIKPKYFIFENVNSMSKENKAFIDKKLGVSHIMINSSLLTAQQRKRIYWVGKLVNGKYEKVKIEQPDDQKIYLKDIIESGEQITEKAYTLTAKGHEGLTQQGFNHYLKRKKDNFIIDDSSKFKSIRVGRFNKGGQGYRVYSTEGKSVCLSSLGGGRGAKTGLYEVENNIRKLTPKECERLQGFPDNYTSCVSNTQAYKALGNSFTVPVIKHILKSLWSK